MAHGPMKSRRKRRRIKREEGKREKREPVVSCSFVSSISTRRQKEVEYKTADGHELATCPIFSFQPLRPSLLYKRKPPRVSTAQQILSNPKRKGRDPLLPNNRNRRRTRKKKNRSSRNQIGVSASAVPARPTGQHKIKRKKERKKEASSSSSSIRLFIFWVDFHSGDCRDAFDTTARHSTPT